MGAAGGVARMPPPPPKGVAATPYSFFVFLCSFFKKK
jgi:hypothetical protein